jgi:hypothetical protein
MPFLRGWFTDEYLDEHFDSVPEDPSGGSGSGGVSVPLPIGTIAPRPSLPPWRQVPGPAGLFLTDVRNVLQDAIQRDHLWGNHVTVEFSGAGVPVRVATGLGGPAKGYKIVRSNADVRVWDAEPPAPEERRGVIWLQASGAARVTLYIY